MEGITVKEVFITEPEYGGVYDLREEVLRKPLGLSLENEDLSADKTDTILAAIKDGNVIGCLMLQPKDKDSLKLRQMAVTPAMQGQHIGRLLVQHAEELARHRNYNRMILHARDIAQGFYKKLGYTTTGDMFTEVGIPHVVMEKTLKTTPNPRPTESSGRA